MILLSRVDDERESSQVESSGKHLQFSICEDVRRWSSCNLTDQFQEPFSIAAHESEDDPSELNTRSDSRVEEATVRKDVRDLGSPTLESSWKLGHLSYEIQSVKINLQSLRLCLHCRANNVVDSVSADRLNLVVVDTEFAKSRKCSES